jgi:hypothetical protein
LSSNQEHHHIVPPPAASLRHPPPLTWPSASAPPAEHLVSFFSSAAEQHYRRGCLTEAGASIHSRQTSRVWAELGQAKLCDGVRSRALAHFAVAVWSRSFLRISQPARIETETSRYILARLGLRPSEGDIHQTLGIQALSRCPFRPRHLRRPSYSTTALYSTTAFLGS